MEIIGLITKMSLFAVNSFAVCFICIAVSKWHRRMEDKLDDIATKKRTIVINEITVSDTELRIRIGDVTTVMKLNDVKELIKKINNCKDEQH